MIYICVKPKRESDAILSVYKDNCKVFEIDAYIGKNGTTSNHIEGDLKTPIGKFEVGKIFGTHSKKEIPIDSYIEINPCLYWIDDAKSMYYNQLVDIRYVSNDWNSAEHLIDFPIEYEYAMEIKINPNNIPNKGSALFLHCSNHKPTSGCVAIDRTYMEKIIKLAQNDKNIIIEING